MLNWLEIIRFREIYPFKNYSRMSHNLVGGVKKRPNSRIVKFKMVHSRATSNILYQLVVLYEDGEVICFCENSESNPSPTQWPNSSRASPASSPWALSDYLMSQSYHI